MGTDICAVVSTIDTTNMEVHKRKRCTGRDSRKYLSIKHELTYI